MREISCGIASWLFVGMSNRNAGGYWLVGMDGGVFTFGDAAYDGSVPGVGVAVQNVVAITGD